MSEQQKVLKGLAASMSAFAAADHDEDGEWMWGPVVDILEVGADDPIQALALPDAKVSNETLETITGLKALVALEVAGDGGIDIEGIRALTGLEHLTRLKIAPSLTLAAGAPGDPCPGVTDEVLEVLGGMSALTHLGLNDCPNVTDAGLAHLTRLEELVALDLRFAPPLTDAALESIAGFTKLEHLDLEGAGALTDAGVALLGKSTSLTHLDLTNAAISDASLEVLSGLENLEYLGLRGCEQLSEEGLTHLSGLDHLDALHLEGCPNLSREAIEELFEELEIELPTPEERDLGDREKLELAQFHALGVEQLGINERTDAEDVIVKIGERVDAIREGAEFGDQEAVALGVVYGHQLAREYEWEWIHLTRPEMDGHAVADPDRTFVIFPIHLVVRAMRDKDRENTVVLLFNMIGAENLPDMDEDSYTPLW